MSGTTGSSSTPVAHGNPTTGAAFVLAASLLWGTIGTVASFAPAGASPVAVGAAAMGIGGLITFAMAARTATAVLRAGAAARTTALLGGACVVVYPLAFYSSMSLAGVAVGTVVNIGSSPVFAALYERFADGRRLNRRWAIATACAGIGCVVLVGAGGSATTGAENAGLGIALGLVAGATYAGSSYLATRIMRLGHSSAAAMGAVFGLGACVLLPVLAVTGGPLLGSGRGLLVVAYLAVVPMYVAYALFGAGLRRVGASTATTLSLFETVVAAVLSVVVVGELLTTRSWTGMALIMAGLLILTVGRRPPAASRLPATRV